MYAANVKSRRLNFRVSGMLWNRSLVMEDLETGSFWSHILGTCEDGKLKGTALQVIPSTITTWKDWSARHPKTTVLDLSPTADRFKVEFYRAPERYVYGFQSGPHTLAFSCKLLTENQFASGEIDGTPILATFDSDHFAARSFQRTLGGTTLTFSKTAKPGILTDSQTGSLWDAATGTAIEGRLKGKPLTPAHAFLSYRRAWENFHPGGKIID